MSLDETSKTSTQKKRTSHFPHCLLPVSFCLDRLSSSARSTSLPLQVRGAVRRVVGSDVPPDAPLMSSGLDSLGAVELRNSLEAALGLKLPATVVSGRERADSGIYKICECNTMLLLLIIGTPFPVGALNNLL